MCYGRARDICVLMRHSIGSVTKVKLNVVLRMNEKSKTLITYTSSSSTWLCILHIMKQTLH